MKYINSSSHSALSQGSRERETLTSSLEEWMMSHVPHICKMFLGSQRQSSFVCNVVDGRGAMDYSEMCVYIGIENLKWTIVCI